MLFSKRTSFAIVFFVLSTLVACNYFPYAKTNQVYRKHNKELIKLVKEDPSIQTIDQLPKAAEWVGTTNFDLRKPNFVIIHHTAQNLQERIVLYQLQKKGLTLALYF